MGEDKDLRDSDEKGDGEFGDFCQDEFGNQIKTLGTPVNPNSIVKTGEIPAKREIDYSFLIVRLITDAKSGVWAPKNIRQLDEGGTYRFGIVEGGDGRLNMSQKTYAPKELVNHLRGLASKGRLNILRDDIYVHLANRAAEAGESE
jgi:hypothetical protein